MSDMRIALVSGANRGIGLEIVRQLSRRGIMAAIGARDPAKGHKAAESLKSEGLEAPVVALDVTDQQSCQNAAAEVVAMFGRLDILVNNAGISLDGPQTPSASVLSVTPDVAIETFRVNTLGALMLTQAAVPAMQRGGYGRIVNLSSGLGQLSEMGSGFPAYRLSKAALNALTRTTAAELKATNIKVNAMCPGWVRTDMGGPDATRSVEVGAETAIWLATLEADGPSGGFFRDKKPIAW
jgi:NAD(P)-dependent dehydrogenase (short-subunit alcohol dehydrogenase family)